MTVPATPPRYPWKYMIKAINYYAAQWRALFKFWRKDLLAGVTVGIVALPLALGFAVTTGAPPQAGLVTAIIAGMVAALFGGSNFQVSGPTGAMTVVLVPIVAKYGFQSLFLIGVLAGLVLVIMSLLRLGNYIEHVPWSVLEGFTLGIALVIALQQIPLLFEIEKAAGSHTLSVALESLSTALSTPLNWASILIALGALLIKRSWARIKKLIRITVTVPASFIAIVLTTTLAELLDLDIARIGEIPANLFSNLNFQTSSIPIYSLIYAVFAVALLGAIESLLSARVADAMAHKELGGELSHHEPNRELFGQGIATALSSLSGGMPATGAIARTTVNVHAGARTRFAAITHSLFLIVVVFLLAPIVALIPTAALAGVLLGTSFRIANPVSVREALRTTNDFRIVYLITAVSVLAIDLIWGVLIGIFFDRVMKLAKAARERKVQ